jgi:hypothetical protein
MHFTLYNTQYLLHTISVIDGQRRDQGTQRARLEGRDLDRTCDLDQRARYWNCLSEDLVLGGQEETNV